jgi:NAD(P)-dependent dehydrogenase (short-subunit alcohol dehydrogenase family)
LASLFGIDQGRDVDDGSRWPIARVDVVEVLPLRGCLVIPRTWFVTGCSTGVGRAIATALIGQGERVAVTARDPATLDALVALAPDRVTAHRLDITRADEIAAALAAARAAFGDIDVLVNNAGSGHAGLVEDVPLDVYRAQFETNVLGPVALIKAVLPAMRARRAGQIVNISSVAGLIGFPRLSPYCAAKFALGGISEALAAEVAGFGIGVTIVELGPFATEFTRSMGYSPPGDPEYDSAPPPYPIGNEHWDAGEDVDLAASALVAALAAKPPPLHLVLGRQGAEVVALYDERRRAEREHWASLSRLEETTRCS